MTRDHQRLLEAARSALAAGEWSLAQDRFGAVLSAHHSAEALDGLGVAAWWLGSLETALRLRAQAYTAYREDGQTSHAIRTAVWLAREYRLLLRNDAVAAGWLARARSLAETLPAGDDERNEGWILLAQSEAAPKAREAIELASRAVRAGRASKDQDLEIAALARCGVLAVSAGDVTGGITCIDEAMAAATAGEAHDPQYVGEAICALVEVANLLGDAHLLTQWAAVLEDYERRFDYAPLRAYGGTATDGTATSRILSSYCGSCCGAVYLVTGRLDEAERELTDTVRQLEASGLHSRCVHPVIQLAELRIAQGRLGEAERMLAHYADLPECTQALASLDLALGHPHDAAARLEFDLDRYADQPLACLPVWNLLVDVQLALGDTEAAGAAAEAVARVAATSRSTLHHAQTNVARGKVAAARGDVAGPAMLREGARGLGDLGMPLAACRARLAYARAVAETQPGLAAGEARACLSAFERLGAGLDADAAAALLRQLGVKGRTGPKHVGALSRREQEVLMLVSQGLSNSEIADRLFISTKTAGHHVSSILVKLGVRSRTEAAAYAVVLLPNLSAK